MKLNASQFRQRLITGIFFGSGLLIPLFLGKIPGLIVIGVLGLLTILEYLQLQGLAGNKLIINTMVSMGMYLAITLSILLKGITLPIEYATFLALAFGFLLLYRLYARTDPFNFKFQVLPATLYIAIPLSLLYSIANWNGSYKPIWVLAILLFVWINDVMAYVVGRKFGKHPFSKYISPNKTWEGTIAGWLGAVVMALALWQVLGTISAPLWVLLGLVIAIASSLGDLIESLFKRKKGIKDSGTFLPGHGGLLDRIDSLLFAMPFIALFFLICI